MALIIEDGSGIPNANSYIDIAYARQYASARGLTLPDDETAVESLIFNAMDKIESYWNRYQGKKSLPGNALQWPRQGVILYGSSLPTTEIPKQVKDAAAQFAIDSQSEELMPNRTTTTAVVEERVEGAVTVKYAAPETSDGRAPTPVFTKAESYLEPLFKSGLGGAFLRSVRI